MFLNRIYLASVVGTLSILLKSAQGAPSKSISKKHLPDAVSSDASKATCYNFTEGNKKSLEFYSPDYPNRYPSNANCVLRLEAEFGYVIRIFFLDAFHIESSPRCEYDYLEIRDGAFGYSPLLGRFCGQKFPPLITSSDRYLWFRFKSDGTIEYRGFKAAYRFSRNAVLDRPEIPACHFLMEDHQGVLSSSNISREVIDFSSRWNTSVDCIWEVRGSRKTMIYVNFTEYELARPNDCEVNFIEVFQKTTDMLHRKVQYCGKVAQPLAIEDYVMFVRFFAHTHSIQKSNFKIIYTFYRKKADHCEEFGFDCEDETCIHVSLLCNGFYNCKNRKDEEKCIAAKWYGIDFQSVHIIGILIVCCLLMGGMIFIFFYNCVTKLLEDHRSYQESLRRSMESSLNTFKESARSTPHLTKARQICRRKFHHPDEDDDEYTGCYAAGTTFRSILDSALFLKERNDSPSHQSFHSSVVPSAEMADSCVQTRDTFLNDPSSQESIRSAGGGADDDSPPQRRRPAFGSSVSYFFVPFSGEGEEPPLPARPAPRRRSAFPEEEEEGGEAPSARSGRPPNGPPGKKLRHSQTCPRIFQRDGDKSPSPGQPAVPCSFRTEAVIEFIRRRPRSVDSTRSAPGKMSAV